MRWSYKTVHYELRKEGLLGSAFLDESEVEKSLNEYGKAGWELVSMMETTDGVIAVFKQPIDLGMGFSDSDSYEPRKPVLASAIPEDEDIVENEEDDEDVLLVDEAPAEIDEYEVIEEVEAAEEDVSDAEEIDVGSIRIE